MESFIYHVIILATAVTLSFFRGLGVAAVADMQCGLIGNSNETQVSAIRDEMFYLDVEHPAPCAGKVTSWTVCYYGPDDVRDNRIYWALYAIYRRNVSQNGDHYERVSDTFAAVRSGEDFLNGRIVDGGIVAGEFNCYNDTIDNGDSSLTVEAGDVLGACVFDPLDAGNEVVRRQLDIVGEVVGESLLEMNDDECIFTGRDREIPLSVERSELSPTSSRRLHLYAIIAPFPDQETTTSSTAITTTVTVASPSDNHVAIAAGAVCGGVVILVITISLMVIILKAVCFKNKPVVMETTLSVADCTVSTVVTEDNTAYGCSQLDPVIPAESTVYETLDLEENTTDEGRRLTEKPLTSVNAAYKETPVILSPNAVYNIAEGFNVNTEKDIVTKGNAAYGCSQLDPVIPAESTVYETLDLEESTTDKGRKSTEKPLSSVNAAYKETEVNLSPNIVYNITEGLKVNTEKDIVTKGNAAYGCSQLNPTESFSITDQKQASTPAAQKSSDQHLTSMVENVAYEGTTVHLSPNMAYNTHQFERETEEEVEYTYVSS